MSSRTFLKSTRIPTVSTVLGSLWHVVAGGVRRRGAVARVFRRGVAWGGGRGVAAQLAQARVDGVAVHRAAGAGGLVDVGEVLLDEVAQPVAVRVEPLRRRVERALHHLGGEPPGTGLAAPAGGSPAEVVADRPAELLLGPRLGALAPLRPAALATASVGPARVSTLARVGPAGVRAPGVGAAGVWGSGGHRV
ncbi:hypothetical protein K1W54_18440, partial [Micromonospora sp. CPCC 205371]|nr:hypothetical protein [Micromonospora sp. CPCC 205371]